MLQHLGLSTETAQEMHERCVQASLCLHHNKEIGTVAFDLELHYWDMHCTCPIAQVLEQSGWLSGIKPGWPVVHFIRHFVLFRRDYSSRY